MLSDETKSKSKRPPAMKATSLVRPASPLKCDIRLLKYEHIIPNGLVKLYVLNLVFGEKSSLRHFKSLGETIGDEHALQLLHCLVLHAERVAFVRTEVGHNSARRSIDIKVGGVAIGIDDANATLF